VKLKKRVDRSKLGRRSRSKGSNYERTIAKRFSEWAETDFVRSPLSGGFHKNKKSADEFRGDIVPADRLKMCKLLIECKCQKTWSLPAWLRQAESDAKNNGKTPIVVFHQHGTSNDYVCLRLDDFYDMTKPTDCFAEGSNVQIS
jgi:hypothetical protein